MATRRETLRQAEGEIFDVCVIGGGATGAGCALDAQLRGWRTILIEAADFAARTSSASTKMAHGGIRYLQAAAADLDIRQYRLVEHALHERAHILRNAPHLAARQEFLVPCFSQWERFYYGVGLKLYDRIAGKDGLARSRVMGAKEAARRLPALRGERLTGAVSYADGQFDDARLGLALVLTFVRCGGAALNYTRAVSFDKLSNGTIEAVRVAEGISGGSFRVRARRFINATGPFSDAVRRLAAGDTVEPRLRPSKGVHILFPLDSRWRADGMVVPKTEDGRVVFAFPYNGRLLIGTTDTPASPDDDLSVTRAEVEYLLRQTNPYLETPLTAAGMVSGFAGIRPLVRSRESTDTSKLIRDDEIEIDEQSGLISILGGKWTTYRRMAEKTVDALGPAPRACVTRVTPLSGSEGFHPEYWRELRAPEDSARHLARKFGTDAAAVLRLAEESPGLALPLVAGAPTLRAEVVYAVRQEMANTLEDVLARRTGLELYSWRMAMEAAPEAAGLMGRELGWSATEASQAAASYAARIRRLMDSAGI